MERVAIDILGPLPETYQGNKYILIAMDYFSKWPEAYALPSQEAVTVADVLVSLASCTLTKAKILNGPTCVLLHLPLEVGILYGFTIPKERRASRQN